MTAAEFRRIRKSLDPILFAQYREAESDREGPGRPPSDDEVTQKLLGRFLGRSQRSIQRYEGGSAKVPDLVEREMRRIDPAADTPPRKKKRA